ncbi:MAG: hypothetical protein SCALA701_08350 [Candidatus Scalindua sp.]|nr:MAG: hypothetical protein SCALA701_08350 [Candidatus Scalindua sp.]
MVLVVNFSTISWLNEKCPDTRRADFVTGTYVCLNAKAPKYVRSTKLLQKRRRWVVLV